MRGGGKIRRRRPNCKHLWPPEKQTNSISDPCEERHTFPYDGCYLGGILSATSNSALARFTTGTSTTLPSNEVAPFPARSASSKAATTRLACSISSGDGEKVAWLWKQVDEAGGFDLSTDRAWERVEEDSGFVSGRSTHADRLDTIRLVKKRYGRVIDPHTADGVKIALRVREPRHPMVCLETALPVKFEATIVEALGEPAPRPAGFEGIERLPQRFEVMKPDPEAVKQFIARPRPNVL